MKWISVEDRLPDEDLVSVLVFQKKPYTHKNLYWLAVIWKGEWLDDEEHLPIEGITHWMPLPDPPKEPEG